MKAPGSSQEGDTGDWPPQGRLRRHPDRAPNTPHRLRVNSANAASHGHTRPGAQERNPRGASLTDPMPAWLSKPAFPRGGEGGSPCGPLSCRLGSSFCSAPPGASLLACKMGSKARHAGLLLHPTPRRSQVGGVFPPSVPSQAPNEESALEFFTAPLRRRSRPGEPGVRGRFRSPGEALLTR